jgi:hypothetical protein
MNQKNANPAGGDGAAKTFERSPPNTLDQPAAQASAILAAFNLLNEIVFLGGNVFTVDGEILVHVPKRVSIEARERFYDRLSELKAECIALILRKNGVRS